MWNDFLQRVIVHPHFEIPRRIGKISPTFIRNGCTQNSIAKITKRNFELLMSITVFELAVQRLGLIR